MKAKCPVCGRMIGRDALSTDPVFAWHFRPTGTVPGRIECPGSLGAAFPKPITTPDSRERSS